MIALDISKRFWGLLALTACLMAASCDNAEMPLDPEPEPEPPCTGLCGKALLEGYDFHEGIYVYNVEAGSLVQTDSRGRFVMDLPPDGIYNIVAFHALFISDTVTVEVRDSTGVDFIEFRLRQYLKAELATDKESYSLTDTLRVAVQITNLMPFEVCGPRRIREDQMWLRSVADTTQVFPLFSAIRSLPSATPYQPFEARNLIYQILISSYDAPKGRYQVFLAGLGPNPVQHSLPCTVSLFGPSFGPAKGWIEISIIE